MTAVAPILAAEQIERRFDSTEVLAGASIRVNAGEGVALLGQSGCGKTTLLQILGLLDRPTRGRVLLGPHDAWSLSARQRAHLRLRHIGFVFQEHHLLQHLTARENVALPAWRLEGSRRHAFAAADRLLERIGLADQSQKRAALLSRGQAQRVAIARALVNQPSIVLADEPTGSLDSASTDVALEALQRAQEMGAALVVVTHNPIVARRADRTLEMLDGRVSTPERGPARAERWNPAGTVT